MKKIGLLFVVFALILSQSSLVFSHSGRTDSSGGHNCSQKSINKGLCTEYHYHNGGSSSTPAPKAEPAPAPTPIPEPVVDEKQVLANEYYENASSFYENNNYRAAIGDIKKMYELERVDEKAKTLLLKSVDALYQEAKQHYEDGSYDQAIENVSYILSIDELTDSQHSQFEEWLRKVESEKTFQEVLDKAKKAYDEKEYSKTIQLLEEAKAIKEDSVIDSVYNVTIETAKKEAASAYEERRYEEAVTHYKLLQDIDGIDLTAEHLEERLNQIQSESLIEETFPFEDLDREKNNLYNFLMKEENEVTPNPNVVDEMVDYLTTPSEDNEIHFYHEKGEKENAA